MARFFSQDGRRDCQSISERLKVVDKMPDVQPVVKNPPSNLSKVLAVVVALLGAWQAYNETKKPVVPVVPVPVVNPPSPTPIDEGVKVIQHGKPVVGPVEPNRQFSLVPDDGLTLTESIESADEDDIDCEPVAFTVDGKSKTKLICTIRNGKVLSVIVTGGNKPAIVRVTCNTAPNPPPVDPTPKPVDPVPNPSPVINAGVRVVLLRSTQKAMSIDQVAAFNSPKVAELLDAKCMKDGAGLPAWHRWDSEIKNPPDAWAKLLTAIQSKMASDKLECPLMAVQRGQDVKLYEITTETALLNTLNQVFGGV